MEDALLLWSHVLSTLSVTMKAMDLFHIAILLTLSRLSSGEDFPFKDPTLPWEERLDDLVNRLTLEEMVLQVQVDGGLGLGVGRYS